MNFFRKERKLQEAVEVAECLKEKMELCSSFLEADCASCVRNDICTLATEINKDISSLAFGNNLSVGDMQVASRKINIIVDCEHFVALYPFATGCSGNATFHSSLPCDTCDARHICKIAVMKSSVDKQVRAICNIDDALNARVLCWSYKKREDGDGK